MTKTFNWTDAETINDAMKMAVKMENFNLLSSMNYEMFKLIKEEKERINEKTNEKK